MNESVNQSINQPIKQTTYCHARIEPGRDGGLKVYKIRRKVKPN